MTACIDPVAIKEGDLIAFVEGEADDRVRDHVARCVACASKVAQIRETSRALLTLAYRVDCPAPEVLGQYQINLLSPSEKLKVAAHVRSCPHCIRELMETDKEEDSLVCLIRQMIQGVVQIIETPLLLPQRGQLVRRAGVMGEQPTLRFHSDAADIVVGFESFGSGSRRGELWGTVARPELVSGSRAWLFREGDVPISTPVDSLGTFVFGRISPGEYDLAVESGEKALLMRGVIVDEP